MNRRKNESKCGIDRVEMEEKKERAVCEMHRRVCAEVVLMLGAMSAW